MSQATQASISAANGAPAIEIVRSRLDALALARAVTSGDRVSEANIARALRAFAPLTFNDAHWFTAVEQSVARLREAGALNASARPASAAGAMKRLGVRGQASWSRLSLRVLPGLGLGVAGSDAKALARLRDHEDWAGAVVARAQGLWLKGSPPSWRKLCDALVWRSLRLPGNPKETPPEVRAHFLGQIVGQTGPESPRLLRYLAARESGAVRPDLRSLREALVRRWLAGVEWSQAAKEAGSGLNEFADSVRQAAAQATVGVYGRRKVFIASLWRSLRTHPTLGRLSLDEFKRELVAAKKAGLILLARADLVAAMNPREVAESETRHLEARYHFVEREESL